MTDSSIITKQEYENAIEVLNVLCWRERPSSTFELGFTAFASRPGRYRSISSRERMVKRAVCILRMLGEPIAGNGRGYWLTDKPEDIQNTIDMMFTPHYRAMTVTVKGLKKAGRRLRQEKLNV